MCFKELCTVEKHTNTNIRIYYLRLFSEGLYTNISVTLFLTYKQFQSSQCSGDYLGISLSGDPNLNDARKFCGTGTTSLVSDANRLAIGKKSEIKSTEII